MIKPAKVGFARPTGRVLALLLFLLLPAAFPGLAISLWAQPGICGAPSMMDAIATDFVEYHKDVPPSAAFAVLLPGDFNPFDDWRAYAQQQTTAGLMPLSGKLQFQGVITDGGDACTDPVGDNFMLESEIGTMSQQALTAAVTQRMQSMTPAEMQEMSQSMMSGASGVDPMGQDVISKALGFPVPMLPPSVMNDLEGSAMFEVYSPNGVSWIVGGVLGPTATEMVYEHNGLGGWMPNAAASVWIVLPGTRVSDLKVGGKYKAIMPSVGDGTLLYVRTDGNWTHRDMPIQSCEWENPTVGFRPSGPPPNDYKSIYRDAFEGTILTASTASALAGQLEVVDISGGQVRAQIELDGPVTVREHTYEYVYSDNLQDECEFGRPNGVVRTERKDTEEYQEQLKILGILTAPASVEVTRPGRRIMQTRTVSG